MKISLSNIPEVPTMPCFVIGNGPGRAGFDINELRGRGLIIGCNFFFQDIDHKGYPFFLVSMDGDPLIKIARAHCNGNLFNLLVPAKCEHKILSLSGNYIVVDDPSARWQKGLGSSGLFAFKVARHVFKCDPIFSIGIGNDVRMVNGIYQGNMYRPLRNMHEVEQEQKNNIEKWKGDFRRICKPWGNVYQITEDGPGFPWVSWEDVIKNLPVRYAAEEVDLDGFRYFKPVARSEMSVPS